VNRSATARRGRCRRRRHRPQLGAGQIAAHGDQKLFGLFGGRGIDGTAAFLQAVGIPAPHVFVYVVGLTEFLGGILLLLGLLTIIATIGLVIGMAVAIAAVSHAAGFFVTPVRAGWELDPAVLGLVVALLVMGPGRWDLDAGLGMTRR
jgi:putative oxidoreductase